MPLVTQAGVGTIGSSGATAKEQAIRLGSACRRVWIVGDSLTIGSAAKIRSQLTAIDVENIVDGVNGRRVSATAPGLLSGVIAARTIRATNGEADCWVVALGTNDLSNGVTTSAKSKAAISEMMAEIPTPARVWWVNVDFHAVEGSTVDYPAATQTFNTALAQRDASDARFTVIDWYALAEGHREWFVDAVHVTNAGHSARASLIVDSLRRSSGR